MSVKLPGPQAIEIVAGEIIPEFGACCISVSCAVLLSPLVWSEGSRPHIVAWFSHDIIRVGLYEFSFLQDASL